MEFIENDNLEVNAGAQGTLQTGKQYRVVVKVLPEVRSWLFGMNQAHFPALFDQVRQDPQKWPFFDVEVLDVGRADPKRALHFRHPGNHFLEVSFVCDVLGHGNQRE